MPIHRHRRERLLLRHHVIERVANLREFRRGEIGLLPDRRETRRQQQRIVLAQRNIECGGQPR